MIATGPTFIKIGQDFTSSTCSYEYSCSKCGRILEVFNTYNKTYIEKCYCDRTIKISSETPPPSLPPTIKNTFFNDMNKKYRIKQGRNKRHK